MPSPHSVHPPGLGDDDRQGLAGVRPAVEFPGLRLLASAFVMEDSMRARRIITRAILAAGVVGSIATGVAVSLATAVTPATAAVASPATPDSIGYSI
jgi:hypothetical protein